MTTASTGNITFAQFLTDASIDEHSEWVDGMVMSMHAVADRHDELVRWLNGLLDPYSRRRKLGRLLGEPFVMHLPDANVGRSPDLFFVAANHLDRIMPKHLEGPADLAIEVISPESRYRDRVHKFAEYEKGGVDEYWLIDPTATAPPETTCEFFRRDEAAGGRFVAVQLDGDVYRTPIFPDAAFNPDWLNQTPLPDPFDIWAEWGLT